MRAWLAAPVALVLATAPFPALARGGGHSSGSSSSSHSSSGHSSSHSSSGHSASHPSSGHAASSHTSHSAGHSSATGSSAGSHHSSSHSSHSHGKTKRDPKQREAFMKSHPCPSTGKTHGACPGYVVDHVQALKHGGADTPSNMQWQTVSEAKAKDKWE